MEEQYTTNNLILDMFDDNDLKEIAPYTFGNGNIAVFKKGMTFFDMQKAHPTWNCKSAVDGVNHLKKLRINKCKILYDLDAPGAELLYLPAERNLGDTTKKPYVILAAGGGYAGVCSLVESIPTAAALNRLGIDAFCLNYRSGKLGLMPRPLEDMASALQVIQDHAEEWHLLGDQYTVCGFSAGGHLAGMWAVPQFGYQKYHLPKPKSVWLIYPMVNADIAEKAGKISALITKMIMFGILPTRKKINEWNLSQWITNDYAPIYLSMAKDDDTIPQKQYLELIASLERNHIHTMISYVESGSHGYGLGVNTAAEGWLEQAVNFNQQIDERIHDNCHRVGK